MNKVDEFASMTMTVILSTGQIGSVGGRGLLLPSLIGFVRRQGTLNVFLGVGPPYKMCSDPGVRLW